MLNSLVRAKVGGRAVREMVRWMMAARKNGRWGNTQENALAMEALVAYYRAYESETPDFRAVARLGGEDARAPGVPRPLHDVEREGGADGEGHRRRRGRRSR